MPSTATILDDVPNQVWSLLWADATLAALVKPGNRINTLSDATKLKFEINEADLPEVVIVRGQFADNRPLQPSGDTGADCRLSVQLVYTDQADKVARLASIEQAITNIIHKAGAHLGLHPYVVNVARSTDGILVTDVEGKPVKTARSAVRAIGLTSITVRLNLPRAELVAGARN